MRDTSLRARLLCWLGLHSWRWTTWYENTECRGCRNCPAMQAREADEQGRGIGRWQAIEPEPQDTLNWL